MKRRSFLKYGLSSVVVPNLLSGKSSMPFMPFLNPKNCNPERKLIIIQLNGGNDGLNAVMPLDQYDLLQSYRPGLLMPSSSYMPLQGHDSLGFHPAMEKMHNLQSEGKCAVVQNVGYPMPNLSHFRSTDIWTSGSDSNQFLYSGILGRSLYQDHQSFPEGYPNDDFTDPLALQIGSTASLLYQGPTTNMGISISNPDNFYQLVSGTVDPAPSTKAGHELTYIRLVAQQTERYTGQIRDAANNAVNLSNEYPDDNGLAQQLKIVARMIAGGLKTQFYLVQLGGFDTHSDQVDDNPALGTHSTLLNRLSVGVNAFLDDLKLMGKDEDVLVMTFSEFGRRIRSNASVGTDHGEAAPLFLFGNNFKNTVIGENPAIPREAGPQTNVEATIDFRSVYATILKDWFCYTEDDLDDILLRKFGQLPIFNDLSTAVAPVKDEQSVSLFPNPCHDETNLTFYSHGEKISIRMLNSNGREMMRLPVTYYPTGSQSIHLNVDKLQSGVYFCHVRGESFKMTLPLVKDH